MVRNVASSPNLISIRAESAMTMNVELMVGREKLERT